MEHTRLYLQRKRPLKDKQVAVAIERWHELDDTLGHRKLTVLLGMGHNRINRMMHTYGIVARCKKKRYVSPGKTDQTAPHLVRELEQSSPTKIVFSDTFEVRLSDGSRVRGCFALWKRTRHILALAFDYRMQAELVVTTIKMIPLRSREPSFTQIRASNMEQRRPGRSCSRKALSAR